jgi:hypothetical protein
LWQTNANFSFYPLEFIGVANGKRVQCYQNKTHNHQAGYGGKENVIAQINSSSFITGGKENQYDDKN